MDTAMLALLGKTINIMESLGFLWLVYTGYELNLWELLQEERSKEDIQEKNPEWNHILLEHWLDQAKFQKFVQKNNDKYFLTRLGNSIVTFRDYGLEAMYKEFAVYWGAVFAELPTIMIGETLRPKIQNEMENELISRASRSSEFFVWPLLKRRFAKENCQRILDIGCGEGFYLLKLMEEFPMMRGLGIEINPMVAARAIEGAKPYQDRLEFLCADIFSCPSPSEKFDCCLLNNNIYYFSLGQRRELLKRLKEWLAPQGQIGILTALRGESSSIPILQTHIPQNLMSFFLACHDGFEGLPKEGEISELLSECGYVDIEVIPLPFKVSHYFFARKA